MAVNVQGSSYRDKRWWSLFSCSFVAVVETATKSPSAFCCVKPVGKEPCTMTTINRRARAPCCRAVCEYFRAPHVYADRKKSDERDVIRWMQPRCLLMETAWVSTMYRQKKRRARGYQTLPTRVLTGRALRLYEYYHAARVSHHAAFLARQCEHPLALSKLYPGCFM